MPDVKVNVSTTPVEPILSVKVELAPPKALSDQIL
jgi:hypothetical protein